MEYAIQAADQAEATAAWEEAAAYLRIALELLPEGDTRRPRLLGRLGMVLAWCLAFEEATELASEAGELIAASEGGDEAASYLVRRCEPSGGRDIRGAPGRWRRQDCDSKVNGETLPGHGLPPSISCAKRGKIPKTRAFRSIDPNAAKSRKSPRLPNRARATRSITGAGDTIVTNVRPPFIFYPASREDVLANYSDSGALLLFVAGEYRRAVERLTEDVQQLERQGRVASAAGTWAFLARCHYALGDFASGRIALERGDALAARLQGPSMQVQQLGAARFELAVALDIGFEQGPAALEPALSSPRAEDQWSFAAARSIAAVVYARLGMFDEARHWVGTLVTPLERAPGWTPNYTAIACDAAAALWILQLNDHIEVFERNLREKTTRR